MCFSAATRSTSSARGARGGARARGNFATSTFRELAEPGWVGKATSCASTGKGVLSPRDLMPMPWHMRGNIARERALPPRLVVAYGSERQGDRQHRLVLEDYAISMDCRRRFRRFTS